MEVLAEIISIGDELLAGYTINTNAAYISWQLRSIGIYVKWITVIADNDNEILIALQTANKRAGVITVTGGLGPTPDDITKATVCTYFNSKLIEHPKVIEDLKLFIKARGYGNEILEKNRAQALVPKSAQIISNIHGTAPGLILKKSKSVFCFMPGVPKEMKAMISNHFLEHLQSTLRLPVIETRVLRTTGISEAGLHDQIKDILEEYPEYSVAYLPKPIGVDLRFRITYTIENSKNTWLKFVKKIQDRINTHIFTTDERNMERVLFDILHLQKLTLAVAESFTGGLLQDWLTNVAGSSVVFKGGVIAYSNESKISVVDINSSTIKTHGAVSAQTALELARGVQKKFKSDCSISTTGIAGPGGGTEEKPVGLCFIAACFKKKHIVKKFRFTADREINKMRGAMSGMDVLRRLITDYNVV
jgi:nicotinamide-nucleotide amidase